jgi:uncharacterized DUF497 family protein
LAILCLGHATGPQTGAHPPCVQAFIFKTQLTSVANEAKHGISFVQAAQIFKGPILKRPDDRKDYGKQRFIALGTYDGEVLRVVFTERDGD